MLKINNFRGDISDISAKTATLLLFQNRMEECFWDAFIWISVCATYGQMTILWVT